MEKKKIVFVSHCVLNTASKVARYIEREINEEEITRKRFLWEAVEKNIHLIQLPCPEFNLYGANRWGHTKDQFQNSFFIEHSRKMLEPYILQMKEYIKEEEKFEVLGIIGIDGSPSCGVNITCCGNWGGEFSGRNDIGEVLKGIYIKEEKGVFMEVLERMMNENGIELPMIGLKDALERIL